MSHLMIVEASSFFHVLVSVEIIQCCLRFVCLPTRLFSRFFLHILLCIIIIVSIGSERSVRVQVDIRVVQSSSRVSVSSLSFVSFLKVLINQCTSSAHRGQGVKFYSNKLVLNHV